MTDFRLEDGKVPDFEKKNWEIGLESFSSKPALENGRPFTGVTAERKTDIFLFSSGNFHRWFSNNTLLPHRYFPVKMLLTPLFFRQRAVSAAFFPVHNCFCGYIWPPLTPLYRIKLSVSQDMSTDTF